MSELIDVPQPNWQCNWLKAWELIWGCRPRWPVYVIVWCNVWVDDPQPNWQCNWLRAWELIWGWRPRLPVYVIVWFYAGVDVTQPNWHKACNENCFWRSRPRWHVYLTVDCNVGADVLHPNWYQDCWVLIRRKGQLFCVFSNKSVCSLPALLALANDL